MKFPVSLRIVERQALSADKREWGIDSRKAAVQYIPGAKRRGGHSAVLQRDPQGPKNNSGHVDAGHEKQLS